VPTKAKWMAFSKFREMAEDFVKIVNRESSDLDAIEKIEHDLLVYYEDVANEPDVKQKEHVEVTQ